MQNYSNLNLIVIVIILYDYEIRNGDQEVLKNNNNAD